MDSLERERFGRCAIAVVKSRATRADRRILVDVLGALERDSRFGPGALGVEVDDGVVTLTGSVADHPTVAAAAELVARVRGVTDVANELAVARPAPRDDTAIARAVRRALARRPGVPETRIDAIVRHGIVTLEGSVDRGDEKWAAIDAARRVAGVLRVDDRIDVARAVRSDAELFDDVRSALDRRVPLNDIDVSVERGVVTLTGRERSAWFRGLAETVAWGVPGVREVVSAISTEVPA